MDKYAHDLRTRSFVQNLGHGIHLFYFKNTTSCLLYSLWYL